MARETPLAWRLISVLFSSLPLAPDLALSLYQVALELHRAGESRGEVLQEGAEGRVRNLRKSFALGAIAGPGFEADIETERDKGLVRFLITREGLERARRKRPELPS